MTILQSWTESVQYIYQWNKIKEFWSEFFATIGFAIWYGVKYFWWLVILFLIVVNFNIPYGNWLALFIFPLMSIVANRAIKKTIIAYFISTVVCGVLLFVLAILIRYIIFALLSGINPLNSTEGLDFTKKIMIVLISVLVGLFIQLLQICVLSYFDEESALNVLKGLFNGLMVFFKGLPIYALFAVVLTGLPILGVVFSSELMELIKQRIIDFATGIVFAGINPFKVGNNLEPQNLVKTSTELLSNPFSLLEKVVSTADKAQKAAEGVLINPKFLSMVYWVVTLITLAFAIIFVCFVATAYRIQVSKKK
ncbi:MAG: hypothetical protein UR26_C0003G0151 [candidate division TM6 bacterium GW2011_GWF2_32_72]|nr:MAG: hypothetical protein UR26_C0003G0151 [candidate division TM6 bacterium GW2011_GWF2_32_72]